MSLKQIQFLPKSKDAEQLVPMPKPTKSFIPQWWNSLPAFANGKGPAFREDGSVDSTLKMCVPFSDTLRFGYIQETWCDIHLERENGSVACFFSGPPAPLSIRNFTHLDNSMFNGYSPIEFAWHSQWLPKLPKGYSAMIGHPLNRTDLPFYTLSGIVDADKYFHDGDGSHPFFIKENFTGIIPAGTPMYQIIPFKRDSWESIKMNYDEVSAYYNSLKLKRKFWGVYKNEFWSKKIFK